MKSDAGWVLSVPAFTVALTHICLRYTSKLVIAQHSLYISNALSFMIKTFLFVSFRII